MNLAPVLDVYRHAGNFIDRYQRCYSSNPSTRPPLGGAFITAQQRAGVAATAKHFPGLGRPSADQDTDARAGHAPRVAARRCALSTRLPYTAAIAAGVKLVMVSWAVIPGARPAPAGRALLDGHPR